MSEKITAVYVRTSTKDQHGEGQQLALEKFLAARDGDRGDEKWFKDIGHTGTNTARPYWEQMVRMVEAGEVKEIVCGSLDRLGRKLRDLKGFTDMLREKGVVLRVLAQNIDLSTPSGRMFCDLLSVFAEYDHAMILERMEIGKLRYKQKGLPMGRPHRITPEQVAKARTLQREGHSIRYIAQAIGANRGAVHRALTKEMFEYVRPGTWRQDGEGGESWNRVASVS